MSDLPDHLKHFLPEHAEPIPAARFDAWIAEEEAASEPLPEASSWTDRVRTDLPAFAAMAAVFGVAFGLLWLTGKL